jgi:hypothetical protein
MLKRLVFAATGLLLAQHSLRAEVDPLPLCPGSSQVMADDPLLRDAFKAAYPKIAERKGKKAASKPCVYPYQAILYESAVVLLTLGQIPGEACHGCGAKISAVFLKKNGSSLTPAGRHDEFAETGTFGSPSAVTPVRFGADDGVVIQGGGTFQGITSTSIEPFVFQEGRVKSLGPQEGIATGFTNCGAKVDGEPCSNIDATWRVDPGGRLLVTYSGTWEDKSKAFGTVIYERRGVALVLVSGAKIAAEMNGSQP